MKEEIKKIAGFASSLIPFPWFGKFSDSQLLVPVYHLVSDLPPAHVKHLYYPRRLTAFKKDLEFFIRRLRVIYPDKLLSHLCNTNNSTGNGFILTFDDGLREVYEVVAPFLYQMGIPAIFFVNNDFIDNKVLFFRFKASLLIDKIIMNRPSAATLNKLAELLGLDNKDKGNIKHNILKIPYSEQNKLDKSAEILSVDFQDYLASVKPYMDSVQISELQEKGFVIGAHGRDHQLLSSLSDGEIIDQVRESVNDIISKYPSSYRFFAFPFTDYGITGEVLRILHDPDSPLVDASFGTAGLKQDIVPKHIQRIPMEKSNLSASQVMKTEYILYFIKKITGRNLILREKPDKVHRDKNTVKS